MSPNETDTSLQPPNRVPWIVRVDGMVITLGGATLLLAYAVSWVRGFVPGPVYQHILPVFVLVCIFLTGVGLVRGKRYGVVSLAACVIAWIIPIGHFLWRDGLTWIIAAMLVPGLVFGVIPLIVAVKNWRSFEP